MKKISTKKRNWKKAALFAAIPLIVLAATAMFLRQSGVIPPAPWENGNSTSLQNSKATETNKAFIKNLGVEFGPYNPATKKAGAFVFGDYDINGTKKIFLEFGAKVQGPDGTKTLPTFEYYVDKNAKVFAIADGTITNVRFQEETSDYEISLKPDGGSSHMIYQDHVRDITVEKGDRVKAGDTLGTVGIAYGTIGRTEIMVTRESFLKEPVCYCPFKFFDPDLIEEYKQKVSTLMSDWEEFKGDTSIYDESKDIWPGCTHESLTDE